MKNFKSKKLNKRIHTICNFNNGPAGFFGNETTTIGTDPTNTTATSITTINTHIFPKS